MTIPRRSRSATGRRSSTPSRTSCAIAVSTPAAPAAAPDLRFHYYLLVTVGFDAQIMGQFLPATPVWGLPPFAPQTSALSIIQQGSLVLDAVSPTVGQVVWRCIAQTEIEAERTPEQRDKRLREVVRELVEALSAEMTFKETQSEDDQVVVPDRRARRDAGRRTGPEDRLAAGRGDQGHRDDSADRFHQAPDHVQERRRIRGHDGGRTGISSASTSWKVGDKVNVTYYASTVFQVRKPGTKGPAQSDSAAIVPSNQPLPGATRDTVRGDGHGQGDQHDHAIDHRGDERRPHRHAQGGEKVLS